MDENETRVLYSAIADFTQVIAKAAEAKAALQALKAEEKNYNDSSVAGAAQTAAAKEKSAASITKVKDSLKESADAASKEAAAFEKEAAAVGKSGAAHEKASKSSKAHKETVKELGAEVNRTSNFFKLLGGFLNSYSLGMDKTSSSNKKFAQEMANNADQGERTSRVLNVLERSFNTLGSAVGKVGNINGRALFIGALIPIIASLLALINPLVAGLGALGGAAIGLAGNLGSLVGAALSVGPALAAMGAAIAGIKIAFGGIGGVFQAFSAAQKASGGGGGGGGGPQQAQITQLEQVQRAQEKYRRSVQDITFAEDTLTQARRSAQRQLTSLTEAVERAQLAQDRSNASLQLARENYANILADPRSTKGQKEDARIAVQEAQNNVQDTKQQNQYNSEDLAAAQKEGIEGNQQVVQAERGVTDAIWAVRDAQLALINAQRGVGQSQGAAAQAANLYQAALAKLSPSAREVVLALIGMKKQWDELHKSVQEAFFSKVVDGVKNLVVLFPVMTRLLAGAAGAAGDVANNFLKMVESPAWIKDFGTLAERNTPLIHTMGGVLLNMLDTVRNLTLAAGPFAQKVADAFLRVSDNLNKVVGAARDDGSLAKWLDTIYNRLATWWDIVKNISKTVFNYASAAAGLGDELVGGLDKLTKGWLAASEDAKKAGSPFQKWLDDIKPVLEALKRLLGSFFDWFGKTAADPKNIQQMTDILDLLTNKVGPGLAAALKAMTDSGVGKTLVSTVGDLVDAIGEIMKNGGAEGLKTFMGLFQLLAGVLKAIASIPGGGFVLVSFFTALGGLKVLSLLGNFSGIMGFFNLLLRVAGTTGVFSLLDKIPLLGKLRIGQALTDRVTSRAATKASDNAVLRTRRAGGNLAAQEAAGKNASQQVWYNRSPEGRKAKAASKGPQHRADKPGFLKRAGALAKDDSGYVNFGAFGGRAASTIGKDAAQVAEKSLFRRGAGTAGRLALFGTDLFTGGAGSLIKDLFTGGAGLLKKGGASLAEKGGAGLLGTLGKGALRGLAGGPLGMLASMTLGLGGDLLASSAPKGDAGASQRVGGHIISGAATGAGIGAGIGSIIPGVGTVVGGAVGGVIGGAAGLLTSSPKDQEKFWKNTGGMFSDLGKNIGKAFGHGADQITKWWNDSVIKPLSEFGKTVGKWWDANIGKPLNAFAKDVAKFWNGQIVKPLSAFAAMVSRLWNDFIVKPLNQFATTVGKWWEANIGKPLNEFATAVGKWWNANIAKPLSDFAITVGHWWHDNIAKPLSDFATTVGSWWNDHISKPLSDFANTIGTWWDKNVNKPVADFVSTIQKNWNDFWGSFSKFNLGSWMANLFNGVDPKKKNEGGPIFRSGGGGVPGHGDGDTVPAMLTPGEFVLRKSIVSKIGAEKLAALNSGMMSFAQLLMGTGGTGGSGNGLGNLGLIPSMPSNSAAGMNMDLASLPQGASTVNNNSGTTVRELHVHNPVPEPASESLPKSIRKLAYLQNR